jgi:hypothetical protein
VPRVMHREWEARRRGENRLADSGSKSYLTEIKSPYSRGRWMGLLNSFYYGLWLTGHIENRR